MLRTQEDVERFIRKSQRRIWITLVCVLLDGACALALLRMYVKSHSLITFAVMCAAVALVWIGAVLIVKSHRNIEKIRAILRGSTTHGGSDSNSA